MQTFGGIIVPEELVLKATLTPAYGVERATTVKANLVCIYSEPVDMGAPHFFLVHLPF